ncbi:MAG: hypothetical protein WC673_01055 [Candidatus Paceibacterota bacterium]|jgi:hypothetical protein
MLTPYLNSQFVEKILTDRYGRQFRCLFLVALVDGEVKGKLVAIQPVVKVEPSQKCEGSTFTDYKKCLLPVFYIPKKIFTDRVWLPIVSYFAPKDFSFVMSQMTRAPSLN